MSKKYTLTEQQYIKFLDLINKNLKNQNKSYIVSNEKKELLALSTLNPSFFTNQYSSLINGLVLKNLRDGIGLPFQKHYVFNDNGLIRITDIAAVRSGTADIIDAINGLNDNKDSVEVEEKILDFNKKWYVADGIISPWKSSTSLSGVVIHANQQAEERKSSLIIQMTKDVFQIIKNYPWTDDEILYTGVPIDEEDTSRKIYFAVQSFLDKINSQNGTTAFGQIHEGGSKNFTKKENGYSRITVAIDTALYSRLKVFRNKVDYKSTGSEGDVGNPWGNGLNVEIYDMGALGINPNTDGGIYIFAGPAINGGMRDISGNTIVGAANLEGISDHINYDFVLMNQGAKAKVLLTDSPTPPTPSMEISNVVPTDTTTPAGTDGAINATITTEGF